MTDIRKWLEQHGLERYADSFENNDIELDILPSLGEEDLRELGVSVGHRKRIFALASQPATPAAVNATQFAPQGQRRQLTILFVDLVGSTSLSVRYDPEDMQDIIRSFQAECGRVIRSYGGTVARYMGDGIMVYFSFPVATEFDAEYGIRAGLDMITAIRALAEQRNQPLQIRVGISTGDVVVGQLIGEGISQELAVTGETPNLAARFLGLATPNTLVVGTKTRQLVGNLFDFTDLGEHQLKGFDESKHAWQVTGEKQIESRYLATRSGREAAVVGRGEELQQLQESWQCVLDGKGQLVSIDGEAGIGKSHLVESLRETLTHTAYATLVCSCAPHYQSSPFSPIIRMVRLLAGITNTDSAKQQADRVNHFIDQQQLTDQDSQFILFSMLGLQEHISKPHSTLSPPQLREATLSFLVGALEKQAQLMPLLLICEDLHWIDPSSSEVIDRLAARVSAHPILLMLTHRPEFDRTSAIIEATSTHFTLDKMPQTAIRQLIKNVANNKSFPEALITRIIDKTDGVPLFVEELTRNLMESEYLAERKDRFELKVPVPEITIPNTLQDSLMARLDRAAAAKETAQVAAVIGRNFLYEVLEEVIDVGRAALQQSLSVLTESQLVSSSGVAPNTTYKFKHALVQDAAYASLLRPRRRELHAKTAAALEATNDNTTARLEQLAYHYTQAEQTDLAVSYWHQAGIQSLQQFSLPEAFDSLTRAIELNDSLAKTQEQEEKELELRVHLGVVLIASRGYAAPELFENYTRAMQLCEQLGDPPLHFAVIYGLWVFHLACSDRQKTQRYAAECLDYATRSGNDTHQLGAEFANGITLFYDGNLASAQDHFSRLLDSYKEERHNELIGIFSDDLGLFTHAQIQWLHTLRGNLSGAQQHFEAGSEMAKHLLDPMSSTRASVFAMLSHHDIDDVENTRRLAEISIQGGTESGFPFWSALGYCGRGWAEAKAGNGEAGIEEIRSGLAFFDAIAQKLPLTYWMSYLVEALMSAEQFDEASKLLKQSIAMSEENTDSFYAAELHRLHGELIWLRNGAVKDVEMHFQTAIDLARKKAIKLHEIRAGRRLGQYWLATGQEKSAKTLLSEQRSRWTDSTLITDIQIIDKVLAELA